jgi:hypothetical protein
VARVIDAEGSVTSNATARLQVDPELNGSIVSDRSLTASGEDLALTGSVTAGAPPFLWVVVPASVPSNETGVAGILGSVGWFSWSGTYEVEGWTSLTVTVVDAAGGILPATLDLEEVPPLAGNLSLPPGNATEPGTFGLDLSLAGGLAPFDVTVNGSDEESWNRTVSLDGNATWAFLAPADNSLDLRVSAVDALGTELDWNVTVRVSAGPGESPASTSTLSEDGGGVLLVLGLLATGLYLYRRRGRSTPAVPSDPVAVLRGIIEPADGADRATVELLAEEAGIPLEVVRSTIDRLIVEGTIRTDAGVDDPEVISWTATAPR